MQSPSKNLKVHRDSNSQSKNSLGNVKVHSLTLSYTLGSIKFDSWASLLAHTFVSHCLGLAPKAKVATTYLCPITYLLFTYPLITYISISIIEPTYLPTYLIIHYKESCNLYQPMCLRLQSKPTIFSTIIYGIMVKTTCNHILNYKMVLNYKCDFDWFGGK
jgi:hypothetical protein